jgi:hypothetical protein
MRFGYDVRSVQFYYGPDGSWNHIADEISYDGGWHYFDPTFGVYYESGGNVLAIADARAAADPARFSTRTARSSGRPWSTRPATPS